MLQNNLHSGTNETKGREVLRTKVLLDEFNDYVTSISQPRAKQLKHVRVEALRSGFKNCWEQKDFKAIVTRRYYSSEHHAGRPAVVDVL